MSENIFSGRINFGTLKNEPQGLVAFNFELLHSKSNYVGAYSFSQTDDNEKIEFYNNDLNMRFAKLPFKKQISFVSKLHNYIANQDSTTWGQISEIIEEIYQEKKRQDDEIRAQEQENQENQAELEMEVKDAEATEEAQEPEPQEQDINLKEIFDKLNQEYFDNSIKAKIEWSKSAPSRKRHYILLGSFVDEKKLIRISPCLKKPFVPMFFVESVIHHEMCHAVHETKRVRGRNSIHTKEFKYEEKNFKQYEEAKVWLKENLEKLLAEE